MSADLDRYIEGENLRAKSLLEAFGYIVIPREAATALEAKDKELAALRENNEHAAGHLIDLLARAETAERERDRIADELDSMNNNHRVMAKLLADTGRERDEAREALRNILDECDEAPTDNSAWVVAIQNIARAITGEKP